MTRRSLLIAGLAATIGLTFGTAGAATTEYTTFSAASEGCAGGGENCGTFPMGPFGAVDYDHSAATDGSLMVTASGERGLPPVCIPNRPCVPVGQYHAEASARAWRTGIIQAGPTSVTIELEYRVDEAITSEEPLLEGVFGEVEATLVGAAEIKPAVAGARCADDSQIVGALSAPIDAATAPGSYVVSATLSCASGSPLPTLSWHAGVGVRAAVTVGGGEAAASFMGQLSKVTVTA